MEKEFIPLSWNSLPSKRRRRSPSSSPQGLGMPRANNGLGMASALPSVTWKSHFYFQTNTSGLKLSPSRADASTCPSSCTEPGHKHNCRAAPIWPQLVPKAAALLQIQSSPNLEQLKSRAFQSIPDPEHPVHAPHQLLLLGAAGQELFGDKPRMDPQCSQSSQTSSYERKLFSPGLVMRFPLFGLRHRSGQHSSHRSRTPAQGLKELLRASGDTQVTGRAFRFLPTQTIPWFS